MSCSETYPLDPTVPCDITWSHGRSHSNLASGISWQSPRPRTRADVMREIARAVRESDSGPV